MTELNRSAPPQLRNDGLPWSADGYTDKELACIRFWRDACDEAHLAWLEMTRLSIDEIVAHYGDMTYN